jgi:hypothetical protein
VKKLKLSIPGKRNNPGTIKLADVDGNGTFNQNLDEKSLERLNQMDRRLDQPFFIQSFDLSL